MFAGRSFQIFTTLMTKNQQNRVSTDPVKAVTGGGVLDVWTPLPRNFMENFDTQKQIYY